MELSYVYVIVNTFGGDIRMNNAILLKAADAYMRPEKQLVLSFVITAAYHRHFVEYRY